ncbi:hypothetical protein [uncultured Chryseobacterium sp.]|uniref:DUF4345 family protein n=1 Tax=uncultured Chryseobacterium sp. TaxID=259322 RepID=UPI0025E786A6|nr:hypothetical protein [uncultured Chryseobacterium sp.]
MSFILKFLGGIVLSVGLALVFKPNLFTTSAASIDGYQTIEKRVLRGFLLGIGLFMLFFSSWNSWKLILLAFLIALTVGVMTARIVGLALDGFYTKQIYWLLIEMMILIIFGFLYSLCAVKIYYNY